VTFRDRLRGPGRALVATFVIVPRIEIVELAAVAGFDAVILDQEHGPLGVAELPALVASAQGSGIAALVRVPECRPKAIEAALDVGADGVLVPHVSSGAAAAEAVAASRFAPEGRRGANPWVRAARYGAAADFPRTANDRCACVAMVEGRAGIEAVDEILATAGLDAIFMGPVDLSHALGVPGETEHELVVETVAGLVERGRALGVATAVFTPTPEAARRWLDLGVRLVALSVDTALALDGFRRAVTATVAAPAGN
jgi:2-keto-3-deoxy-L-rhamnonate aldolase RhmA